MTRACLVLAGGVLLAACDVPAVRAPSAPPASLVVTVAPRGAAADDPVIGLPAGSRLLVVDRARPGVAPVDLSDGLAAAGDACVSHDAARIAFVARRSAASPWTVWTCRADGGDRRPAVESATDCAAPAWLPDGRLVYAAVTDDDVAVPAFRRAWALFVAAGDGGPGQRITFGAGLEIDPAVLPDGRIVHAAWRPGAADDADGRFALFTVHSDGAGVALFHGPEDAPAVLRRPRSAPDGRVACVGGTGPEGDRVLVLDPRWPFGPSSPLEGATGVRTVLPTARGGLRIAGPGGAAERASAAGRLVPLGIAAAVGGVVLAAVDLEASPRPQGHLSIVDPFQRWGQLLAVDARFPGAQAAARVRLRHYDGPGPASTRVLGETPLAADGSFFLRVPPDVPLLVDLLDASGAVVAASSTPIWVRPRETRGCIGCHEDPDLAPPNRRPAAVLDEPVDWSGSTEEASR